VLSLAMLWEHISTDDYHCMLHNLG